MILSSRLRLWTGGGAPWPRSSSREKYHSRSVPTCADSTFLMMMKASATLRRPAACWSTHRTATVPPQPSRRPAASTTAAKPRATQLAAHIQHISIIALRLRSRRACARTLSYFFARQSGYAAAALPLTNGSLGATRQSQNQEWPFAGVSGLAYKLVQLATCGAV